MSKPVAYTSTAKIFHWVMAILIIGMLCLGGMMTEKDILEALGLERAPLYMWHKSIGITLLFLALLRTVWRVRHTPPALPQDLPKWQQKSAHLVHCALYVLMIGVPLSGWALNSVSPYNITLFGLVSWPNLPVLTDLDPVAKKALAGDFGECHEMLATLIALALAAHIGAALFHMFIRKDGVLRTMLPVCAGGIKA